MHNKELGFATISWGGRVLELNRPIAYLLPVTFRSL